MAAVKKTKKRRHQRSLTAWLFRLAVLLLVVDLLCKTVLRSINVTLNIRKQEALAEIAQLQVETEQLTLEVEKLNDDDRIKAILNDATLAVNSSNVTDLTN